MRLARTRAIAKKEFKQLWRDKRMLFVLIFFPTFLLAMFGYAVNFDVQNIQLAIYDSDKSDVSRDFISNLSNSTYFEFVDYLNNNDDVSRALNDKDAQVVMVVPEDFSEKLFRGEEAAKIQFLVDGVDGNTANIISNYVNAATIAYNSKLQKDFFAQMGITREPPVLLEPLFWFNPNLETTKFLIPGLIVMILIVTAVVAVSISLVREKERGTIEQINVSSLSTAELLIGKSLPYILLALVDALFILVLGFILFNVTIEGSILLFFAATLVFILAATSQGIFLSVVADSQQVAFTVAILTTLLPSLMLSGFIFPIESMPGIIQVVTNITPAKFFVNILRAIMLRGVGIEAIWTQLVYMSIFILLFLGFASVIHKKKLSAA